MSKPSLPSRHDNPFATCWTRPGAIPFRFDERRSAKRLIAKLADQHWQGAIVGPHGSGKSTLLETLKAAFRADGIVIHAAALGENQRRLPSGFWPLPQTAAAASRVLVIVDGYEQLGWFERAKLLVRCRRAAVGLLVTAHAPPTHLPSLMRLDPNEQLVQRLVSDLVAQVSTRVTPADVAASHACHGSNVREILFDLYDRHEQLRRAGRTPAAALA